MGKIPEPEFHQDRPDIRHVFDIALDAKAHAMPAPVPTGFRSSSLGYCLRRQFLERAGVPKAPQVGSRTLWLGDQIHYGVQSTFKHLGLMLGEEVRFHDDDLQLTGHVDMIWGGKLQPNLVEPDAVSPNWYRYLEQVREDLKRRYETDEFPIMGAELKSAHQYSAEKAAREGPAFHHQMQAGSYDLLSEMHPEQLPIDVDAVEKWQIVMLAKSDLGMPVFDVSPTMKRQARERIEELVQWWESKALPPCTCGVTISWEQRYCPYAEGHSCCSDDLIETAPDSFWEEVAIEAEVEAAEPNVVVGK